MTFLSPAEHADLRATFEGAFESLCNVVRRSRVSDGMGGSVIQETVVYTNIPCHLGTYQSGREIVNAAEQRVDEFTPWSISMPAFTDIGHDDKITIGSRTFEVRAVRTPRTWEWKTRVLTEEVF